MRSVHVLANKAYTSILGALSGASAGSPTSNFDAEMNAGPIAPGTTVRWDTGGFTTRTTRTAMMALMTVSKNGGNLAAGDVVNFELIVHDGIDVVVGPTMTAVAQTAGADVIAFGALSWVVTGFLPEGVSRTYGIKATIVGGHTGGALTGQASVSIFDI